MSSTKCFHVLVAAAALALCGWLKSLDAAVLFPDMDLQGVKLSSSLTGDSNLVLATECGGYIEGLVGGINYKLQQNLSAREECIWTVQVPLKSTLEVRLVEAPAAECDNCYFINIFSVYLGTPKLERVINFRRGEENNKTYNITGGPLYQIIFTSSRFTGYDHTGFALSLLGVGPNLDPSESTNDVFKVLEQNGAPNGRIEYTKSNIIPLQHEVASLALQPDEGKQIKVDVWLIAGRDKASRSPCYDFFGSVQLYEVGWNGGGLADISPRLSECRTNHSATITTPLPLVIMYRTYFQTTMTDKFQIEWSSVD